MEDRDLFIQFYHDGESYEGEMDEWVKSEVGKRVKEIAEISFKAGIREVVEWIKQHEWRRINGETGAPFLKGWVIPLDKLKAKLEEWGIKDELTKTRNN